MLALPRGMVVLVAAMLLLTATGVGGVALFGARSAHAGKAPPALPIYAPLPPLAFALMDSDGIRQVDLTVVLELPYALEKGQLDAHVARIASTLNARLIDVDAEDLRGANGAQRIKDVIGLAADRELRPMRVRQVLVQKLLMR